MENVKQKIFDNQDKIFDTVNRRMFVALAVKIVLHKIHHVEGMLAQKIKEQIAC